MSTYSGKVVTRWTCTACGKVTERDGAKAGELPMAHGWVRLDVKRGSRGDYGPFNKRPLPQQLDGIACSKACASSLLDHLYGEIG